MATPQLHTGNGAEGGGGDAPLHAAHGRRERSARSAATIRRAVNCPTVDDIEPDPPPPRSPDTGGTAGNSSYRKTVVAAHTSTHRWRKTAGTVPNRDSAPRGPGRGGPRSRRCHSPRGGPTGGGGDRDIIGYQQGTGGSRWGSREGRRVPPINPVQTVGDRDVEGHADLARWSAPTAEALKLEVVSRAASPPSSENSAPPSASVPVNPTRPRETRSGSVRLPR